jgi:hypothetical protein
MGRAKEAADVVIAVKQNKRQGTPAFCLCPEKRTTGDMIIPPDGITFD